MRSSKPNTPSTAWAKHPPWLRDMMVEKGLALPADARPRVTSSQARVVAQLIDGWHIEVDIYYRKSTNRAKNGSRYAVCRGNQRQRLPSDAFRALREKQLIALVESKSLLEIWGVQPGGGR